MTWKSEESMMTMCFCCSLPTGLHFVNAIMFVLLGLDTFVQSAFHQANILGASAMGIPRNGEIGIVWGYAALTTFVGSTAITMLPSKKKGMFIKIWRAMLLGFILIWLTRLGMNVTELNTWAWEREEHKKDEQSGGKKGINDFFEKKLFQVIEFALRWFIFEQMQTPEDIAYFSIKHWGILAYYGALVPFSLLVLSFSQISTYLRATNDGEFEVIAGLIRRRDMRKRKQQERVALLANRSRPESPSNS